MKFIYIELKTFGKIDLKMICPFKFSEINERIQFLHDLHNVKRIFILLKSDLTI